MSGKYLKQELFEGIGPTGQRRLGEATVLVAGCGGLGAMVTDLLSRMGVGFMRIVDRDVVDRGNLHRQVLFSEKDAVERIPKAVAAADRVAAVNPEVKTEPRVEEISPDNVLGLLEDIDIVFDGTDNMETRYLLNDACVKMGIPWVYAGVIGSHGTVMPVLPEKGPCFSCLFPNPPDTSSMPTCETAGVIPPAVYTVASLEVAVGLNILLNGYVEPYLLYVDVWNPSFRKMKVKRRTDCACCIGRRFDRLEGEAGRSSTPVCGRNAVQLRWKEKRSVDLNALAARLRTIGEVSVNRYRVVFRAPEATLVVFADGRAIVEGVTDPTVAATLYDRYVGG